MVHTLHLFAVPPGARSHTSVRCYPRRRGHTRLAHRSYHHHARSFVRREPGSSSSPVCAPIVLNAYGVGGGTRRATVAPNCRPFRGAAASGTLTASPPFRPFHAQVQSSTSPTCVLAPVPAHRGCTRSRVVRENAVRGEDVRMWAHARCECEREREREHAQALTHAGRCRRSRICRYRCAPLPRTRRSHGARPDCPVRTQCSPSCVSPRDRWGAHPALADNVRTCHTYVCVRVHCTLRPGGGWPALCFHIRARASSSRVAIPSACASSRLWPVSSTVDGRFSTLDVRLSRRRPAHPNAVLSSRVLWIPARSRARMRRQAWWHPCAEPSPRCRWGDMNVV
ncbi:hypothetical protein C8Q78DRAFT_362496 [Trametes maxima]|nr:hypothetical protein C8Q78DRAFT_362496 [Trametes maxima]